MNKVIILGYGVVGQNIYNELKPLKPDVYDKYKAQYNTVTPEIADTYDFAFICVDTLFINPTYNPCDLSQIRDCLNNFNARVYVIKSTILPGMTENLIEETDKNIIFSPEYYGGTQHCNNFNFDFTILGGEEEYCRATVQLLQEVYDARHRFFIVDSRTAELAKYMENSWLAMKVCFCNQFYDIAQQVGVSYEKLRELFILDPRVNPSHTFVYADHPYYDSHCLNKDIPAIAAWAEAPLLDYIIQFNNERKAHFQAQQTAHPASSEKIGPINQ